MYTVSEHERSHAVDYRPHARRHEARQRVARLEDLVIEMRDKMQGVQRPGLSSAVTTGRPASSMAEEMGKLSLTDDQAVYTGSSHWVTILEDVS